MGSLLEGYLGVTDRMITVVDEFQTLEQADRSTLSPAEQIALSGLREEVLRRVHDVFGPSDNGTVPTSRTERRRAAPRGRSVEPASGSGELTGSQRNFSELSSGIFLIEEEVDPNEANLVITDDNKIAVIFADGVEHHELEPGEVAALNLLLKNRGVPKRMRDLAEMVKFSGGKKGEGETAEFKRGVKAIRTFLNIFIETEGVTVNLTYKVLEEIVVSDNRNPGQKKI